MIMEEVKDPSQLSENRKYILKKAGYPDYIACFSRDTRVKYVHYASPTSLLSKKITYMFKDPDTDNILLEASCSLDKMWWHMQIEGIHVFEIKKYGGKTMKITFEKKQRPVKEGDWIFFGDDDYEWNIAVVANKGKHIWYASVIKSIDAGILEKDGTVSSMPKPGDQTVDGAYSGNLTEISADTLLHRFVDRWDHVKVASPSNIDVRVKQHAEGKSYESYV